MMLDTQKKFWDNYFQSLRQRATTVWGGGNAHLDLKPFFLTLLPDHSKEALREHEHTLLDAASHSIGIRSVLRQKTKQLFRRALVFLSAKRLTLFTSKRQICTHFTFCSYYVR
jgi:hypothetical protein